MLAGADIRAAGQQLRGQAGAGFGDPNAGHVRQLIKGEIRTLTEQQCQAVAQLQGLLLQRGQVGPQLGDQCPLLADRQAVVGTITVACFNYVQHLLGGGEIILGQLPAGLILYQLKPVAGDTGIGADGYRFQIVTGGVEVGCCRLDGAPVAPPEIHFIAGVECGVEVVVGALVIATAAPAAGAAVQLG